jgi:hypothetical protein
MKPWIFALAIAGVPSLALAAPASNPQPAAIALPRDSRLIGVAAVDEIHEFPEARAHTSVDRVIGVSAIDRAYSAERSYDDTVSFFDQQLKQPGWQLLARTTTPSATSWIVKRPDGTQATLIVRRTLPVTFETVQVAAATESAPK